MSQNPWGPPPQQQSAPQGWGQPAQPAQQAPWGAPANQPPAQQAPPAAPGGVEDDPFAINKKTPAVSFKDAPIGAYYVLRLTEHAVQRQETNFDTGELDFWPPSEAERAQGKLYGNPKMAAVVRGIVVEGPGTGEERSIWAPLNSKAGSSCAAIAEAQRLAGQRMAPGGLLKLELVGIEAPDPTGANRNKSPRKLYAATYTPPPPGGAGDAFAGGQPAQQAPAPQQQAPQGPPPEWAAQQPPVAPQDASMPAPQGWGQQTPQHFQQVGAGGQPGQGYDAPQQAPQGPPPGWGGHEQQAPPAAPAGPPSTSPWG